MRIFLTMSNVSRLTSITWNKVILELCSLRYELKVTISFVILSANSMLVFSCDCCKAYFNLLSTVYSRVSIFFLIFSFEIVEEVDLEEAELMS